MARKPLNKATRYRVDAACCHSDYNSKGIYVKDWLIRAGIFTIAFSVLASCSLGPPTCDNPEVITSVIALLKKNRIESIGSVDDIRTVSLDRNSLTSTCKAEFKPEDPSHASAEFRYKAQRTTSGKIIAALLF